MRAVILVAAFASVAHADPRGDADAHARRGVALYNLGKYDDAIAEFEDAYKAFQSDALLFNLAQAHRKLEHCERALSYYHQYLGGSPTPALAKQVEKLLPELEAACRTRDARPDGPAPTITAAVVAPPPPPAPAPTAAPEHADAEAETEAPATVDAAFTVGANAFVGEVISAGNAPITGVHATALWHAFDGAELGAALGVGEMFRYDAMNDATVAQLAAAIEHRTVFDWGRVTAVGELGIEYVSLLGSSRDVVPGVGSTNQWAPLVRGEVGVEHDISPLFALRGAIAASLCPPVGALQAAVGELDVVIGVRYSP